MELMRDKTGKQKTKLPRQPITIEKNKLLKLIWVTNPGGKSCSSKSGKKGKINIKRN